MKDAEQLAIEAIQTHEPPKGYYVAFSGGKDSIVIYDLVKRAGVKFDVHMTLTGIDPPELLEFVRKHYPEVHMVRPKRFMLPLIVHKGIPPTRIIRYCCHEIKEIGGKNRVVVLGLRRDESLRRKHRNLYETSQRDDSKKFLNPIINWTKEDVWDYIREHNLAYPSLYDEGYERIGCIMCPMSTPKNMLKDAERYPKFYNAYIKTFDKMLERRQEKGMKPFFMGKHSTKIAKNGEDVMHWWIYGSIKAKIPKADKLKWCAEIVANAQSNATK